LFRLLDSAADKLCLTFMFTAQHNLEVFTEEVSRSVANKDNVDAEVFVKNEQSVRQE